jgi:hypothetical protein
MLTYYNENLAQMDPDFWYKGWDYYVSRQLAPEVRQFIKNLIKLLSSGFGDVNIIIPYGVYSFNIGQFIQASNIQFQFSPVDANQSATSTYGWNVGDYSHSHLQIRVAASNVIYINMSMEDMWLNNSGMRWKVYITTIAHEIVHKYMGFLGCWLSEREHDSAAYGVSEAIYPSSQFPFIIPWWWK